MTLDTETTGPAAFQSCRDTRHTSFQNGLHGSTRNPTKLFRLARLLVGGRGALSYPHAR